mgnify:FL=1|tara:strand:- start:2291 stop:3487 length:1197 start_codon:yes stop_codon:yes gene_type:complete
MKNFSLSLYLEINDLNYVFYVGEIDDQNNLKIIYVSNIFLKGIENNRISDLEKTFNTIKENLYLIEQKLNYTFREIILILDNFHPSFINLTGFKKLNGSQVLRENITYILNTLKSCVNEIESKKTILHIFNSKFYLDNNKTENLPIGLFGDSYSHELSFILINSNDYKNFKSIFGKCNLNIKKILIKSFIKGATISDNFKNTETFFQINIGENKSKIFYFENNSLKFEQNFEFGVDIIIKDISKITFLKKENVSKILDKIQFTGNSLEEDLIDKIFFNDENYRKIKKKLIYEIVFARIKEMSELILFKNINFQHYNKISKNIFLEIDQKLQFNFIKEIYKKVFSMNGSYNLDMADHLSNDSLLSTANKLVHFGWKKEAIPVLQSKKSLISRFFDKIFG